MTPRAITRLLLFNGEGDRLAAKLRPGNAPGAENWEGMLLPEIERQQELDKEVVFRADAAFAKSATHEAKAEYEAAMSWQIQSAF